MFMSVQLTAMQGNLVDISGFRQGDIVTSPF